MIPHDASYREVLKRFRRGEASREEAREVIRHLLGGCGECKAATSQIWASPEERDSLQDRSGRRRGQRSAVVDYSSVFTQVMDRLSREEVAVAEEAADVPALRAELCRHPRTRQKVLAANSTRFQSWALVESLLEDCRSLWQTDIEESHHLVRLAVHLSESLAAERYGTARIRDLQARCWGEYGNVLRIQEEYREAERAFDRAREILAQGTGDALEKAALLSLEASMWSTRHQFGRAIALLDRTIAIARRLGEAQLLGRVLIKKAQCDTDRGQPEAALSYLLEAQRLLDPTRDVRLMAKIQHNILYALVQAGRLEEAAAGLADTRALYRALDCPIDQLRVTWLEGRIFQGLGQLEEAETCYRGVLEGLLAEGLDYDAALLSLDLALLYSERNRPDAMRELVAAMLPIFHSHRIHREAIAALLVFRDAVAREQVSDQFVHSLAAYLESAATEPQLRFQPPPGLRGGDR